MTIPNQLSLLRILLTPVFVFLFFVDSPLSQMAAFGVFTLASITDWYDGYAARRFHSVSLWGQFLDPLADKILVSSALICFSAAGHIPEWMVLVIVLRDLLLTGMRSYALLQGIPFQTNLFAKAKTMGQISVIYVIFIYHLMTWHTEGPFYPVVRWMVTWRIPFVLMGLITAVTVISGLVYLVANRALLRRIIRDIRKAMTAPDTA